jgi:hypothetical protein
MATNFKNLRDNANHPQHSHSQECSLERVGSGTTCVVDDFV